MCLGSFCVWLLASYILTKCAKLLRLLEENHWGVAKIVVFRRSNYMFASSFTLIPRVPASSFFSGARPELLISCYHGDTMPPCRAGECKADVLEDMHKVVSHNGFHICMKPQDRLSLLSGCMGITCIDIGISLHNKKGVSVCTWACFVVAN